MPPVQVGVVMGSSSDWGILQHAVQILQEFGIERRLFAIQMSGVGKVSPVHKDLLSAIEVGRRKKCPRRLVLQ